MQSDFQTKYLAQKAHQAAVPVALAALRGVPPTANLVTVETAHLNTVVAEVDRLTALVAQQRKDAAEEQREFQREARDIAAESRWQGQEETRGGCY